MSDQNERIVVLGVGNTLLTDEGLGVRVVERLMERYSLPEHVQVIDGGTQGLWLMSTIQMSDHLIVVDAVRGNQEPGAIYRLERDQLPKGLRTRQSAHDSDLVDALNLCSLIDVEPKSVVVIGMEPNDIKTMGTDLSEPIEAKIDDCIRIVVEELSRLGVEPEKKI